MVRRERIVNRPEQDEFAWAIHPAQALFLMISSEKSATFCCADLRFGIMLGRSDEIRDCDHRFLLLAGRACL
jgi:hypothetical protein